MNVNDGHLKSYNKHSFYFKKDFRTATKRIPSDLLVTPRPREDHMFSRPNPRCYFGSRCLPSKLIPIVHPYPHTCRRNNNVPPLVSGTSSSGRPAGWRASATPTWREWSASAARTSPCAPSWSTPSPGTCPGSSPRGQWLKTAAPSLLPSGKSGFYSYTI